MHGPREPQRAGDRTSPQRVEPPVTPRSETSDEGAGMPVMAPGQSGALVPSSFDARAVEVLSHELRSPITTIHLGAKVLRSPDVLEPVREAVLEAVDVEAVRLLRVVEDLLVVARHDAGASALRVEPVLIQRRLPDLVWSDTPSDSRPAVRFTLPDSLPAVMADEEALGHAIRNLLINAATHGASTSPTEVEGEQVGAWLELRVLDRGRGIDPTESERLFRPFYRSLRTGGVTGAGLGLAAARRLARAMAGELVADARPGGGATFTLRLQLAELEPAG